MNVLLSSEQLEKEIVTLANQLYRTYQDQSDVVYVGIQQGGVVIGDMIMGHLQKLNKGKEFQYGQLDITFYRDDIRKEIMTPDRMHLPFSIENKTVVLIDDVLFTGRTIKAALDVLLDYGRPSKVELCVLIDRREHRQFPIQADYVGKSIPSGKNDKVKLVQGEVVLIPG